MDSLRMLTFVVDAPAIGKARHRTGRSRGRTVHFSDPETKAFEQMVALHARAARGGLAMMAGAVRLEIEVAFAPPRSWSRKRREAALGCPHTQKPDGDNIAKAIKDALNGIVYADDKQVFDLHVRKRWGASSRFRVTAILYEGAEA